MKEKHIDIQKSFLYLLAEISSVCPKAPCRVLRNFEPIKPHQL